MAEGDRTNNDAADAGTEGVREVGHRAEGGREVGNRAEGAGSEAAGADPAGFESSGVGDPQQGGGEGGEGGGGGRSGRAGDWNPGEHSGGGGELY
jgi:hypothetical protein